MKKHLIIIARGRVQGVFFRLAAKERAIALGLAGVARNDADGGVLLEVEGEEAALGEFVRWCRSGPAESTVKSIEVRDGEWRGLSEFVIR